MVPDPAPPVPVKGEDGVQGDDAAAALGPASDRAPPKPKDKAARGPASVRAPKPNDKAAAGSPANTAEQPLHMSAHPYAGDNGYGAAGIHTYGHTYGAGSGAPYGYGDGSGAAYGYGNGSGAPYGYGLYGQPPTQFARLSADARDARPAYTGRMRVNGGQVFMSGVSMPGGNGGHFGHGGAGAKRFHDGAAGDNVAGDIGASGQVLRAQPKKSKTGAGDNGTGDVGGGGQVLGGQVLVAPGKVPEAKASKESKEGLPGQVPCPRCLRWKWPKKHCTVTCQKKGAVDKAEARCKRQFKTSLKEALKEAGMSKKLP